MCTRFWTDESPELRPIVEEMRRSPLVGKWQQTVAVKTFGEMRPTDVLPVIAPNRSGVRAVFPMRWGYNGRSLLVNARSETAAIRPTFREDWKKHRCIVPASCYYEWEHLAGNDGKVHTGDKYMLWQKDSAVTWLCGLYRIENGLPFFVILTREPGEEIRFIHDRMPLILPKRYIDDWIRPDCRPEDLLDRAVTEISFEKASGK